MTDRYCGDCRYSAHEKCVHPQARVKDLINGDHWRTKTNMRGAGQCGPCTMEGKLWEPEPPVKLTTKLLWLGLIVSLVLYYNKEAIIERILQ